MATAMPLKEASPTSVSPAGKQLGSPSAAVSSSRRVSCSADEAATVVASGSRNGHDLDLSVEAGTAQAATSGTGTGGQLEQVELARLRQVVDDLENMQLSMEVQHMLDPQGHSAGTGRPSQFITQVARVSVETMHRDRLLETYKALTVALEKELAKATAELAMKQKELEQSRPERDMLLQKISRLEKERDQVSLPPMPSASTAAAADALVEAQEQHCRAGAPSPPSPEMSALQQKYEKQKQSIEKLVVANHRWDEHCRQLTRGYELRIDDYEQRIGDCMQRIAEKTKYVESLTSRLDEVKVNEEKRQKDIDRLLLSTKKRLETVEAERDVLSENLRHVENERSQVTEALVATRLEADGLKHQLEQCRTACSQLQQWQAGLSRGPQALTSTGRVPVPAHEALVADLREQIVLLQQQLEVFRDDFNTERSDRERMQQKVLDLQSQHERLKNDFGTQQRQLVRADDDLVRSRAEVERLQGQLAVQAAEIRSLRQTAVKAWRCSRCTFKNVAGRKFCDICGFAGGVGEDGRPLTVDPSLFSALPPAPSAPNETTGDISSSRTSNLSAELVVTDCPHVTSSSNAATRNSVQPPPT